MIDCPYEAYETLIGGFGAGALPHIDAAFRKQPHRLVREFLQRLKKSIGP